MGKPGTSSCAIPVTYSTVRRTDGCLPGSGSRRTARQRPIKDDGPEVHRTPGALGESRCGDRGARLGPRTIRPSDRKRRLVSYLGRRQRRRRYHGRQTCRGDAHHPHVLTRLRDSRPSGRGTFFLSSSAGGVYAGSTHPPFSESTVPRPLSLRRDETRPRGDIAEHARRLRPTRHRTVLKPRRARSEFRETAGSCQPAVPSRGHPTVIERIRANGDTPRLLVHR